MTGSLKLAIAGLAIGMLSAPVLAQPALGPVPAESGGQVQTISLGKGLGVVGLCVGAAAAVLGGGLAISNIGARATESIARQPEAAGSMFLAWLLPAAMVEGATLFAVLVCYMALSLLK